MITRRSLLWTGTTGLLAGAITHRAGAAQSSPNIRDILSESLKELT